MANPNEEQLKTAEETSIPAETGVNETGGVTAEAPDQSDFDYLKNRTSGRHSDMQFADDNAYYKQMRADADEDDSNMKRYRENEDKVNKLFASDPRSADFFNEWQKNPSRNPISYMIRIYGMDGMKEALDNPEFADEFEKANKEYLDRIAENRDYNDQVKSNLDKTLDMAEAYAQKNGISEEEVDADLQGILDQYKRIHLGNITEADLDAYRKAKNHDVDVENASREAETRGRNAKIRETLRQGKGDGMKSLTGTSTAASMGAAPIIQTGRENYVSGNTPTSAAPETRQRRQYR